MTHRPYQSVTTYARKYAAVKADLTAWRDEMLRDRARNAVPVQDRVDRHRERSREFRASGDLN